MPVTKEFKVTKGMRFRWHYADANPEWEVKSSRGQGVWICEIVDCPDYSGAQSPFTMEQIRSAVANNEMFKEMVNDHTKFFENLKVGQIVHYNDGFGKYVRCKVVEGTHEKQFGKHLLPIHLVGDWEAYDLPKRLEDGSISYCYHADKIRNKELFHPNFSNIWEHSKKGKDPSTMPTIDISVPEMTPEQVEKARLFALVKQCQDILDLPNLSPRQRLENVAKLIKEQLN